MRTTAIVLAAVLCLVTSSHAGAGTIGLGANLGFSAYNPEFGEDLTVFAWPGSVLGFQPGLRVAYIDEARTHEGYLDTSLLRLSGGGESARYLQLMGNYQYNFPGTSRTRPYVTAGIGLFNEQFHSDPADDEGETTSLFGAGAGIRHWVSDDHGSLRIEARFDRINEGDTMIQEAGIFSFRLGFDLWMK